MAAKTQTEAQEVATGVTNEDIDAAQKTAERERKARDARRKADEDAYQASIEGQTLPPSVEAAKDEDKEARKEAARQEKVAQQDMQETTERIASRPNNPPDR